MMQTWSEVQSLAERAALGAGLPFAKAARFGAGVARHLAEHRSVQMVEAALSEPAVMTALTTVVEDAVEAASLGHDSVRIEGVPLELGASLLQALPCDVAIRCDRSGIVASVRLDAPNERAKVNAINVPDSLRLRLADLAGRCVQSMSAPHGAGVMRLD